MAVVRFTLKLDLVSVFLVIGGQANGLFAGLILQC